jgi:GntR family transcriptional regulator / MocR family aminotransferase
VAIEWTGSSPEVLVRLDRGSAEPLRAQLERELREAIRSGRLRPGERLPSTRELAHFLGVSRGLVVGCFEQLRAEGYVQARTGSVTRVSSTVQTPARAAAETSADIPPPDVDFLPAVPDLDSFPRSEWARSTAEACRDVPRTALDYGEGRGDPRLRDVLASYLGRVRGAAADSEHIVICTGFTQGLDLALAVLAARGIDRVAFEDPGYDETSRMAADFARVGIVRVPVDARGIRVDALAATGARAVVLTPAHQWPTGVVLSPERRLALANWAASTGGWVVEDDYDAEFRYDRDPVGVLQGLAPEHVISIGTVSKSLAPAMRLGWMLCPPALVEEMARLKTAVDRGSPGLEQLTLAQLIESGRFDRHLRRMRKTYAAKREALITALGEYAPQVGVQGLAAGLHAVAALPEGVGEPQVVTAARARGVGLYGMSANRSDKAESPPCLVLGFGNLTERAIVEGIARVGDLLTPRS